MHGTIQWRRQDADGGGGGKGEAVWSPSEVQRRSEVPVS